MTRSNWTPSIVPRGDDQNVYLVVVDLGQNGRIWPEADFEGRILKPLSATGSPDSIKIRYLSFLSMPKRVGLETCPPTSQENSACAAIYNCGMSHFSCKGRYHDIQLPLPMRLF
jgi:hypothetical protein